MLLILETVQAYGDSCYRSQVSGVTYSSFQGPGVSRLFIIRQRAALTSGLASSSLKTSQRDAVFSTCEERGPAGEEGEQRSHGGVTSIRRSSGAERSSTPRVFASLSTRDFPTRLSRASDTCVHVLSR
ncbi:hypothetical protein COCON_G00209070 [Conger conger]|uniref:Uncharacterized protein n=1 Tax=Conger conger TaxID=82655 RepID=A0A9Q1CZX5_CONCO|nr:hypothetical protein COCON_G00209070 [Conger conger]